MNRGDTDGKKIKKPSECDRKGESGWRNEIENSRRGGGWERDERERDVRGGGSLSSDWLPPLARSRVLRLAAAPERSHTREGGGRATTQPELSPIHTDSSPPHETRCWFCSWKTKIDVLFYFFCMHAWIMLHWVAGADRVSPPRFYSQKKEKVTTAQRLFGTFLREDTRRVRTWIAACWGELWRICSVLCFLLSVVLFVRPGDPLLLQKEMRAGGGESALSISIQGGSPVHEQTADLMLCHSFSQRDCKN